MSLKSIQLLESDGSVLQSEAQPFLLDSGYSFTVLFPEVYSYVIDFFQAGYSEDVALYIRNCTFDSDLSMTVIFPGGCTIEVPLADSLLPIGGKICVVGLISTIDAGQSVARDPVLRRVHVVYDQESWAIS